ncbi:40-kDa huntingtin-associated protein-like [Anticarsia gemmatalis]|uniref:40-kDa huntingtin-associated protein-like n=1 Tax=Anticarsia gemmatalis TaxID=129554 RepID=UPI003F776F27
MSTDLSASFNEQYMNINTKMKKRFMRKPNVSEATNEFIALAIQCEHSDQPAFAGHSYVGAAKCEASVGNFLGEAEHFLAAARQFMKAEKKLKSLKFYSGDRENLEAATGCYVQALQKYPDKSPLRTSILMELASDLIELNHKCEAASYYEQALEMVQESTMKVMCMRNLLNLKIDCGKYDVALEIANKICDSNLNIPEAITAEVQVSRILLTLLEKPPEDSKPLSLKQLFTDLMNDNESNAIPLNTDIRLKLQSIIICHTAGDIHSLISVAADTKQFLTMQQVELLHALIKEHAVC